MTSPPPSSVSSQWCSPPGQGSSSIRCSCRSECVDHIKIYHCTFCARSLISAQLSSNKLDKGPNRFGSHCDLSTRRRGSAKGHGSSTDLAGAYSERPRELFRRFDIDPMRENWSSLIGTCYAPSDTANDSKIDVLVPRELQIRRCTD